MRVIVFLALLLPTLAASAFAFPESAAVFSGGPVNLPGPRDAIYTQPPGETWNIYNASTGFGSEMADDIPSDLAYESTGGVTFYVGQWGGYLWQPFTSLIVHLYNQSCPPNENADYEFVVPYADLDVTAVYHGEWHVYQCTAWFSENMDLGSSMSVGGLVDQNWGQNPPYCGLAVCDFVFYGCELYWDGDYWGAGRWTPASYYFGVEVDLAYALEQPGIPPIDDRQACCYEDGSCRFLLAYSCLQDGGEPYAGDCDPNPCLPTATFHVSWGKVRGLYR